MPATYVSRFQSDCKIIEDCLFSKIPDGLWDQPFDTAVTKLLFTLQRYEGTYNTVRYGTVKPQDDASFESG